MSLQIEFNTRDTKYIVNGYNKGTAMAVFAGEFGVSIPTIRALLVAQGVTIRPRGSQATK